MGRVTSEAASKAVGSKYDLILIASRRVRELRNGYAPLVDREGNSDISTALEEIEQGHVGRDYLLKNPNVQPERKGRKNETNSNV